MSRVSIMYACIIIWIREVLLNRSVMANASKVSLHNETTTTTGCPYGAVLNGFLVYARCDLN